MLISWRFLPTNDGTLFVFTVFLLVSLTQMTLTAKDSNVTKKQGKNVCVNEPVKNLQLLSTRTAVSFFDTRKRNLSGEFWNQFEMMKMLYSVETDSCVKNEVKSLETLFVLIKS
jgi:hypothetical protein